MRILLIGSGEGQPSG